MTTRSCGLTYTHIHTHRLLVSWTMLVSERQERGGREEKRREEKKEKKRREGERESRALIFFRRNNGLWSMQLTCKVIQQPSILYSLQRQHSLYLFHHGILVDLLTVCSGKLLKLPHPCAISSRAIEIVVFFLIKPVLSTKLTSKELILHCQPGKGVSPFRNLFLLIITFSSSLTTSVGGACCCCC